MMKFNYLKCGTSLCCLIFSSPVWAQTTVSTSENSAEAVSGLREIVVTAQKRSENLQIVPISILAVDGDTLKNKGVVSTVDIGTVASGVTVRINNSAFLPNIRGVGTNATNIESPVSLYVDGVYQPYARGGLRDLGDVDQIAVLKGPQGTLFGRNSTAGVIQITTRNPTQDFHFRVGASIDNYRTLSGNFAISGGLADGIAANAAPPR